MYVIFGWILSIATLLGGIAAIYYFKDKFCAPWYEAEKTVSTAWWESSEIKKITRRMDVKVSNGQTSIVLKNESLKEVK